MSFTRNIHKASKSVDKCQGFRQYCVTLFRSDSPGKSTQDKEETFDENCSPIYADGLIIPPKQFYKIPETPVVS